MLAEVRSFIVGVFVAVFAMRAAGCGGGSGGSCGLTVSPQNATADHTLPPPGNQVQFGATISPSSCNTEVPAWFSSDPNVTIGSGKVITNGQATCLGPTAGPVTITATTFVFSSDKTLTGTASLTCK
jgi:hypothetical protein